MDVLLIPIALAVIGMVALLTVYTHDVRTHRQRTVAARMARVPAPGAPDTGRLFRERRQGSAFLARLLPLSKASKDSLNQTLEQAEWPLGAGEYTVLRLLTLIAFVAAGILLLRQFNIDAPVLAVLSVIIGAIFGWGLPAAMLSRARTKRLRKIEEQLPDALTSLAKSLRAGTGLTQALTYAVQETPAPLGPELERTMADIQLGSEDAFEALRRRVGSADMDVAVTAIIIQRSIGGNLSEILSNVTDTIRDRARIRADVRVMTAEQRLSANIIAFFPVIVALAFIWMQPTIGMRLLTTLPGQIALAGGIVLELIGIVIIRRLSNIDV